MMIPSDEIDKVSKLCFGKVYKLVRPIVNYEENNMCGFITGIIWDGSTFLIVFTFDNLVVGNWKMEEFFQQFDRQDPEGPFCIPVEYSFSFVLKIFLKFLISRFIR